MSAARIREIIRSQIWVNPGTPLDGNTELRADLKADDLHFMCIAVDLEEAFGFEISDAEITAVSTIGDIENLVAAKMKEVEA